MSNNPFEDGDGSSNSSSASSALFFSLSSYSRFHSQDPNPTTMSSNNPEHGSNSSKPSSSLFFNLSSYSRFRRCRSRRISSSSSSSSSSFSFSFSSDSISYSMSEISSAVKNSQLPPSPPFGFCTKNLAIPCRSFKRCTLRNEKVVIYCRHIGFQKPDLSPSHLSTLSSRSHHPSLVKLLGASQSPDGGHIYMVYEGVPGATLDECLRTSHSNPLSNWLWRMQVALDLARGLEYIHHHCGMVHNMIKSSTVIVTEPNSNARICLFGTNDFWQGLTAGPIGYLAPEYLKDGITSQKCDVYAFGVVILELVSGKAAWGREEYRIVRLVETARETICREEGDQAEDEEIRRGRVMQFVDRRLHDSFPMETAESLIKVALKCVEKEADLRPVMASVAEDITRLFLDSNIWQQETMMSPTTALSLSSLLRSETREVVPPAGKLFHYPSLLSLDS